MYEYNSSNNDNHLFTTKLSKKITMKLLCENDEHHISIDLGNTKALDMFRFLHRFNLDASSKTLTDKGRVNLMYLS